MNKIIRKITWNIHPENKKYLKKLYKYSRAIISSAKFSILFNILKDIKIKNINIFEKSIYSQNGEDGIIEYIMYKIKSKNKYYVEFGVEDATESNTRLLREKHGWRGLLMDGSHENKKINLQKEFIYAENIEQLFKKYNVPKEFDILSIDIDFNDFYIWKAIKNYSPRLVIIEYNGSIPINKSKVVRYEKDRMWDGTNYCSASILAFQKLAKAKGYTLIACDKTGTNAFFVKSELKKKFPERKLKEIFKPAIYGKNRNGHPRSKEKMIDF